jgi:hypothetical protein
MRSKPYREAEHRSRERVNGTPVSSGPPLDASVPAVHLLNMESWCLDGSGTGQAATLLARKGVSRARAALAIACGGGVRRALAGSPSLSRSLLDGDRLGEVSRLIDVGAFDVGNKSASQNVPSPAGGYAALACVARIRRAFARLHPRALARLRLLGRLGPVLRGALKYASSRSGRTSRGGGTSATATRISRCGQQFRANGRHGFLSFHADPARATAREPRNQNG